MVTADKDEDGEVDLNDYSEKAMELIQKEIELWAEQIEDALEYFGEVVTIDGEELGDLCPFFGMSDVSPATLFSSENIAA